MIRVELKGIDLGKIANELVNEIKWELDLYGLELRNQLQIHSPRGATGFLIRSYKVIEAKLKGGVISVEVISDVPYAKYVDASIERGKYKGKIRYHVPRSVLGKQSFRDKQYRALEGISRKTGRKLNIKLKQSVMAQYGRGRRIAIETGKAKRYKTKIVTWAKKQAGEDDLVKRLKEVIKKVIGGS